MNRHHQPKAESHDRERFRAYRLSLACRKIRSRSIANRTEGTRQHAPPILSSSATEDRRGTFRAARRGEETCSSSSAPAALHVLDDSGFKFILKNAMNLAVLADDPLAELVE